MSISFKVVSDAAVFCDSFRRSAIRRRMRFIFTRVSFLLPGTAGGGVDSGFGSFGLEAGCGAGFDSSFGGGGASFLSSGGGGEVSLRFSAAWSTALFESSGAFLSGGLEAVSVDHSYGNRSVVSEVHTCGACVRVEDE